MTKKLSKKLCDAELVYIGIFKDKVDDSFTAVPILWNNMQTRYKDLTTDVVYKGSMMFNHPDASIPDLDDLHLLEKYYGTQYWCYSLREYVDQLKQVGCPVGLLEEKYIPIDFLVGCIASTEQYIEQFDKTEEMDASEAFHTSMF